MKQVLLVVVFVAMVASVAHSDDAVLVTTIKFRKGDPITLNLVYGGGLGEWDAAASIDDETLVLSNSMFIAIADGRHRPVMPLSDKVLSVWADTYFREPFSLDIDISEYYDLSEAGTYTIRWGCTGVQEDRMHIEIYE